MIIPIRCMTCNQVIASKYEIYLNLVKDLYKKNPGKNEKYITCNMENIEETNEEKAFKILGLHRYCCRRHLLTHTDLIDII